MKPYALKRCISKQPSNAVPPLNKSAFPRKTVQHTISRLNLTGRP